MREVELKVIKKDKTVIYNLLDALDILSYSHDALLNEEVLGIVQFTGLKDKNGVKIFEGDIVKRVGIVEKGEVMYGNFIQKEQSKHDRPYNCMGYYVKFEYDNKSLLEMFFRLDKDYKVKMSQGNIEVIGNIYKNPELLTK